MATFAKEGIHHRQKRSAHLDVVVFKLTVKLVFEKGRWYNTENMTNFMSGVDFTKICAFFKYYQKSRAKDYCMSLLLHILIVAVRNALH